MMRRLAVILCAAAFTGCSTPAKDGADIGQRLSRDQYAELIKQNTKHAVKYDGFYNKFEVYVTYMNSQVQSAILQRRSDVMQWNEATAQKEREKMFQENATSTTFAVSLFVPSARLNDLHKANTIWKIYLESGGQRYEGKASRRNGKLEEIMEIFPYHTRWSVAYEVVFNVPLSAVDKSTAKFILTSSQGTAELEFPPAERSADFQ